MKKITVALMSLLLVLAGCSTAKEETGTVASTDLPEIGVITLMEHTSLNQIQDAFTEQMKALGYEDGVNCKFDYQNAQGDVNNVVTIVQTFEGNPKDVVVAITTPCAQGAMKLTETTPVVFSAITDPVAAGIVEALDKTDKNITGTSDAVQVDQIIDLALTISPDAKTVGYIYNPGEDNSVATLAKLEDYAKEVGLTVETVGIMSGTELQAAASTLCQSVDFIFVSNDNTVAESMPVLANEAIANGICVYTGADSMVLDGGFATVGIDYTDLGKETANMVDSILKGTEVAEIPVKVFDTDLFIYVNKNTCAALGIELPESITSNEKYVELGE
ncbi:MAG: ABC transporter substrate-binding protein [Erysipelotrichaceae bacterium]|nr:ABC transporter substrate-binding protein [Erysipelotrichaceae bacterium]